MNLGFSYRTEVQRADGLVDWLCREFPHSSRGIWSARVEAGEVEVNGVRALATPAVPRVAAGDVVVWHRPGWEEDEVPRHWAVVHEDEDVVVVDKPAGLPTMPAGGFLSHTLLAFVRSRYPEASPMHRLGRGTSGLVVVGRTVESRSRLQLAWRSGEVAKTYRARVEGAPEAAFVVDAAIGRVAHPRLGTIWAANPAGKASVSRVRTVAVDGAGALVDVDIETGRPHQIRIHLAYAGHPLLGDPLFGVGGTPRSDALPGDLGYFLRAWRIEFPTASGRQQVSVSPDEPAIE